MYIYIYIYIFSQKSVELCDTQRIDYLEPDLRDDTSISLFFDLLYQPDVAQHHRGKMKVERGRQRKNK